MSLLALSFLLFTGRVCTLYSFFNWSHRRLPLKSPVYITMKINNLALVGLIPVLASSALARPRAKVAGSCTHFVLG